MISDGGGGVCGGGGDGGCVTDGPIKALRYFRHLILMKFTDKKPTDGRTHSLIVRIYKDERDLISSR